MQSPRLTRLDQLYPGYSVYFITCCTHGRQRLLANALLHESFRLFCITAKQHQVMVGRYVIMPDHLHFFVAFGESTQLSLWIKSLKNSLSKTLRQQGHVAPHWQKGYFDHLVRSEKAYEEKWLYTRENPVRGKLIGAADDWLYQGEINPLPLN